MSLGLATTRRTARRAWRSTSAIQSVRKGSAVATTTSVGVGAGGRDPHGHANVLRLLVGAPVAATDGPDAVAELLSLDVEGLLPRAVDGTVLVDAVQRVRRGERVVDPGILVGDDVSVEESVGANALTAREREVLVLLAAGNSNREIASSLFVSLPTVKTHLAHIYAKLEAKNRNEALGRAVARGLL